MKSAHRVLFAACLLALSAVSLTGQALSNDVSSAYQIPNLTWSLGLPASGGTPPYTWSVVGGSLPPGMLVRNEGAPSYLTMTSGSKGWLGGTITTWGASNPITYTFTLRVTDNAGATADKVVTLQTSPMRFQMSALPDAHERRSYSYFLKVLDAPGPVTYALYGASTLPAGLSLNPTTGEIYGTVAAGAAPGGGLGPQHYFTVLAQSTNFALVSGFNLQVLKPYITTAPLLSGWKSGVAKSVTLAVTGGTAPYTWTASCCLPGGVSLNSAGVLSGTSTQDLGAQFEATVTDAAGYSTRKTFWLHTEAVPKSEPEILLPYANPQSDDFTVGQMRQLQFGLRGGVAPFSWAVKSGSLPPGMVLTNGATLILPQQAPGVAYIYGNAVQPGDYSAVVEVTDSAVPPAKAERSVSFRVRAMDVLNPNWGALETPGTFYHSPLGSPAPFTCTVIEGRLPLGLQLTNGASGTNCLLSGSAYESALPAYRMQVADGSGGLYQRQIWFVPQTSGVQTNWYSPQRLLVSTAASFNFTAWNGSGSFTWSVQPQPAGVTLPAGYSYGLPPGLALTPAGANATISGTTAASPGKYIALIRTADSANPSDFAQTALQIDVQTLDIQGTCCTLQWTNTGSSINYSYSPTGASGAVTWSLSGNVPAGVSVNSATGLLSGAPTTAGQYNFTLRATDAAGYVQERNLRLSVYPPGLAPPLIATNNTSWGIYSPGPISRQIFAEGGLPPYTWSLAPGSNPLPAGARIVSRPDVLPSNYPSTTYGAFMAVVTTPGAYSFTLRVTDSLGSTADQTVTLRVTPLSAAMAGAREAVVGQPFSTKVRLQGSASVTAVTIPTQPLPAWLTLSNTVIDGKSYAVLSGTPPSAGSVTANIRVSDGVNSSFDYAFGITTTRLFISAPAVRRFPIAVINQVHNSGPITVGGGSGNYTFSLASGTLPNGLTGPNATTGVISGTPTSTGNYNLGIKVTDNTLGDTVTFQMGLTVLNNTAQPLTISDQTLSNVSFGGESSSQLGASGGTPPYSFALDALNPPPDGVNLYPSADQVTAYPNNFYLNYRIFTLGTHTFKVKVTDSLGNQATSNITVKVTPLAFYNTQMPITGAPPAIVNGAFSQKLLIAGGTGAYTLTSLSQNIGGLSLSGGALSGTLLDTGNNCFTMRATDGAGATNDGSLCVIGTATTPVTLQVNQSSQQSSTPGTINLNLTASAYSGGALVNPVSWQAAPGYPLPAGFVLLRKEDSSLTNTTSTAVLAGSPAPGTYNILLQVRDANNNFGQKLIVYKVGAMNLVNSGTLPNAYAGSPYTVQLKRTGGTGPFNYSITSGSLPPGLSLSPTTGAFSGTPSTPGTYAFTVTLTDTSNGETLVRSYTVTVYSFAMSAPDILPAAVNGKPYTYAFTAAGGPYTWTMSPSVMFAGSPAATYPGLTLSPAGVLSGTPSGCSSASTWGTITVTASAGANNATRAFQLMCRPESSGPLLYSDNAASLPDGAVNVFYQFTFTVRNGTPPYNWTLSGAVPPGLALLNQADLGPSLGWSNPRLAGTPTAVGRYTFNLNVTDGAGLSISTPYTLTISPLNAAQSSLPAALYNQPYTQQLVITGGSGACTFSLTTTNLNQYLPNGLSLSSGGLISGTPLETGNFTVPVSVSGCSSVPRVVSYTLQVYATGTKRIDLTMYPNPIQASSGYAWSTIFTPSGGSGTHAWTKVSGVLPAGLKEYFGSQPAPPEVDAGTIGATAMMLFGPPTTPGSYAVTYRVDDQTGNFGVRTLRFYIPPMSNAARLSAKGVYRGFIAKVGQPISINVVPAGGTAPYTYGISPDSNMPPWLTLNPTTGALSGTPVAPYPWTVTVLVTDANGWVLRQQISLYIYPAASPTGVVLGTTVSLPNTGLGDAYTTDLDPYIQAGTGPYTWSLVGGSLPPGLSLSGNKVVGTATAAGDYNFVFEVTDTASGAKARTISYITIHTLSVTPLAQNLPQAVAGLPYTYTLAGANGTPPYTYNLRYYTALPQGLTLNPATGVLSGTPATVGTFRINTVVRDSTSNFFNKDVYLQVLPPGTILPGLTVNPASLTLTVNEGSGVQTPVPVNVSATTGALSYTVSTTGGSWLGVSSTSGATPSTFNILLSATGLTAAGSPYNGSVTITSAAATNSPRVIPVTLTVTAPPPCTYSLSPGSASYTAAGGSGSITLSTGATCAWTATSSAAWLRINGAGSGTGAGTVNYTADPNGSVTQRSSTLTIGGQTFTVTQLGTWLAFTLTQTVATVPATGGVVNVNLVASAPDAPWTAAVVPPTPPAPNFLTLLSAASGMGGAVVSVQVAPNGPSSRTQTVIAGNQILTINQQGASCTYTLVPTQTSLGSTGGTTTVNVSTLAGCAWTASPSAAWISVSAGSPGNGPGTVTLDVAANSSTQARTANVVIGDQTFPVTQSGVACSFSLSANNPLQPAAGGTGTIDITANGSNCSWVASSNAGWLGLSSTTGTGNASLTYTAASTSEVASRSATLTIAGQNLIVNQSGIACSYNLRSPSAAFPAVGGPGSTGVITPAACGPWSVSGLQNWITLNTPASGNSGPSEVQFTVANNTTASPRSASLTVAGQSFTITQDPAPCTVTLTPPASYNATELGGASSFAFTTSATGCNVPISSMSSWIQVTGTSLVGTAGTVNLSISQNGGGARSGVIMVGDQNFTVNQAATTCSYTLAAYSATTASPGGPGSVGVTYSSAACLNPSTVVTPPGSVYGIGFTGTKPNMTMGYTVTPFTSITPFIRTLQVDVGNGQYYTVKQTSW